MSSFLLQPLPRGCSQFQYAGQRYDKHKFPLRAGYWERLIGKDLFRNFAPDVVFIALNNVIDYTAERHSPSDEFQGGRYITVVNGKYVMATPKEATILPTGSSDHSMKLRGDLDFKRNSWWLRLRP